jgi:hypothetical protein
MGSSLWLYSAGDASKLLGAYPQYINHVVRKLSVSEGIPVDLLIDQYVPVEVVGEDGLTRLLPKRTPQGYLAKRNKKFTLYTIWFVKVASILVNGSSKELENPYVGSLTYDSLAGFVNSQPSEFNYDAFRSSYPDFRDSLERQGIAKVSESESFSSRTLISA